MLRAAYSAPSTFIAELERSAKNTMAKQRHIGYVIFAVCSMLSARIAFLEPEPHVLTPAEERWGYRESSGDHFGLIHGLRYYIYGIGVIGLLIVAEDSFSDRLKKKRISESGVAATEKKPNA